MADKLIDITGICRTITNNINDSKRQVEIAQQKVREAKDRGITGRALNEIERPLRVAQGEVQKWTDFGYRMGCILKRVNPNR